MLHSAGRILTHFELSRLVDTLLRDSRFSVEKVDPVLEDRCLLDLYQCQEELEELQKCRLQFSWSS
jgi:hypothetical protein